MLDPSIFLSLSILAASEALQWLPGYSRTIRKIDFDHCSSMISQKKCVLNCHNPAPSFLSVTRQSRYFYQLNKTSMLICVFMLLFKGCRVWISSSLLGWEDTQGRGPPSCYALHDLLQVSPAQASVLTETLVLLVLQGQSKHTTSPKNNGSISPCPVQVIPAEAEAFCHPAHTAFLPYASDVVFQSNSVPICWSSVFCL